ncbi:MAG: DUF2461 domain-containing protein [Ignavibacteria bacterium]|nr:DUF2461 domain-containing protein [Ignavibacteria bacterium]
MKNSIPPFKGFSQDAFDFLSELRDNNNLAWFNSNRERYQNSLVVPARSFITEMAQFFNRLYPAIRTEPKFNETIMRINKDLRFSKGEPYRDYFLIHFGRFKMDSEFYVSFEAGSFDMGLFINNSPKDPNFCFRQNLEHHTKEFLNLLDKYELNYNFELYELIKGPEIIDKHLNGQEHLGLLKDLKMMLIQKSFSPKEKIIYSPDFVLEAMKAYSLLFPVYCFAVFPEPLKMIEEFEEQFGVML